jgi:hypothetical protein
LDDRGSRGSLPGGLSEIAGEQIGRTDAHDCRWAWRSLLRHLKWIWKRRYDFDRTRGLRILSRVTRWPSGWNVERQQQDYEDQD